MEARELALFQQGAILAVVVLTVRLVRLCQAIVGHVELPKCLLVEPYMLEHVRTKRLFVSATSEIARVRKSGGYSRSAIRRITRLESRLPEKARKSEIREI
jgi:hypothetical protein